MPRAKKIPDDVRFWSYVKKTDGNDCWNWIGGINSTHRGIFCRNGKSIHAHRMAWIITNGDIPSGMCICHKCDNGLCCNPQHLFIGTQKDNMQDKARKGRGNVRKGDDDPKSILTSEQVKNIRKRYVRRLITQQMLANEYGVSRSTIESVILRHNWKTV